MEEKINLIYILGRAYTGSTLLEMILDTHPDIVGVGEMIFLKRIYNRQHEIQCSCLKKVEDCNFWTNVFNEYKTINPGNNNNIFDFRTSYSPLKNGLKKLKNIFSDADIKRYGKKNYQFFNIIKNVSGKKYIVDASKDPFRLYMLKRSGLFNIKVIYLYRNGQASIDSFKKRNSANFNIFNRMFYFVAGEILIRKTLKQGFKRQDYFGLRYEDFTSNFNFEIIKLLDFLGLYFNQKDFTDENSNNFFLNTINKNQSHIVGGNIYRLQKIKEIKNFDTWKKRQTPFEKYVFLLLFGKYINKTMTKYLH